MDFDGIIQSFGWSGVLIFVMYCLGVFALSLGVRRVVEVAYPKAKVSLWWTDVILPGVPILLGALIGLVAKKFPFPAPIAVLSGRLLYGVVAGFLSGWVYRMVRGALKAKSGVELPDPPGGGP